MNKNIKKTKRELTIVFTVVVFWIIVFLGVSFFSLKYYKDINSEKESFNNTIISLEKINFKIEDIKRFPDLRNDFLRKKTSNLNKKIIVPPIIIGSSPRLFVNYIRIKDNQITSFDIKDNLGDNLIENILHSNNFENIGEYDGFLVKKINLKDEDLILFKKLSYSYSNYLNDILLFIGITIFLSGILYFVGYRFINRTFIPIENNMKDMKDFIHNAGHELKTPISVIDSNIQIIKDNKTIDLEMLDEIKNETQKLNSLINSLIKLSDIDSLKQKEKVNLKNIFDEITNDFKAKISDKKLKIKIEINKNIVINSNKDYLYILLSNLIGNAIKYNKNKGEINIVYKSGTLKIIDSGIGISKEELDNIFDRFYKTDSSRNSEGFGIGLSLVKKIADIYKWNIKVESEIGKGSSFVLKF